MKSYTLFCSALCLALPSLAQAEQPVNPQVDYAGFLNMSSNLEALRQERLVSIDAFLKMAEDPDTIILDTRSKAAYDAIHLKGAVHLNFSDFTDPKLAKVIPAKTTRILIYCNNNFMAHRIAALTSKRAPLALNIPTFINLHGYGYENIYELKDLLPIDDPRLEFEGTELEYHRNFSKERQRFSALLDSK